MTNRLEALEDWAAGLLGQLEPASRNKLARSAGQVLRRSQQQRIIAQQNPDGSKYAARKWRNLRGKQGRMKRKAKMFHKLRTATFLKLQGDAQLISLGYIGRASRIAKVHHYGLKDKAERDAADVQYARRQILGFSHHDLKILRDLLLLHIAK